MLLCLLHNVTLSNSRFRTCPFSRGITTLALLLYLLPSFLMSPFSFRACALCVSLFFLSLARFLLTSIAFSISFRPRLTSRCLPSLATLNQQTQLCHELAVVSKTSGAAFTLHACCVLCAHRYQMCMLIPYARGRRCTGSTERA